MAISIGCEHDFIAAGNWLACELGWRRRRVIHRQRSALRPQLTWHHTP
jgi:hypothetical protein